METRRLANFIAIVDCGSLTRAAERMNIAQPALSQQLAALEAGFGKQLVVRSRQGVNVTPAGQVLYRNAQTILRQMEQMETEVRTAGEHLSGHVSVGLPVSCAPILALPLLRRARERYPYIGLRLSENLSGMLGELILKNRLDIALLYSAHGSQGLTRHPLLMERLCLVIHRDLAGMPLGETVSVQSLAEVPLVLPSHSNGLRALVDAAFSRHGLTPRVTAELDSLRSLKSVAEEGMAATILPRSAASQEAGQEMDGLRVVEITDPFIERRIVLCTPAALSVSEPVAAIRDLMIEVAGDLVRSGTWRGVSLL